VLSVGERTRKIDDLLISFHSLSGCFSISIHVQMSALGNWFSSWDKAVIDQLPLIILGALMSTVLKDLTFPQSSRFVQLRVLISGVYWMIRLQLLFHIIVLELWSINLTNFILVAEFALTFGLSYSIRCYVENDFLLYPEWIEKYNLKLDDKSKSNEPDDSAKLLGAAFMHQDTTRLRLNTLGRQTLASVVVTFILWYFLLYGINKPQWTLSLWSLCCFIQGRICRSTVSYLAFELEGLALQLSTDKTRTTELNKLAFMQFVLHEVRVPLNSVVLGIDLLCAEKDLSEDIRETLDMMQQSAGFMVSTLNDVLSWQRIEQGKMELNIAPFFPHMLVKSVLSSFR
jgi:signal transduction histidine kinase